jgi:hypothetical protein
MPNVKDKAHYSLVLLFCVIVLLTAAIFTLYNAPNLVPLGVTKGMVSFCKSTEINTTAGCLTQFVGSFYKYKATPDIKGITIYQLIEDGGDCKNYADFYNEAGKLLGYNTKIVTIKIIGNSYHQFTVISDKTGYCIMDNKSYACGLIG